jgi:hypothetical protein
MGENLEYFPNVVSGPSYPCPSNMDSQGLAWYFVAPKPPLNGNWQIPITSYLNFPTLSLLRAEKYLGTRSRTALQLGFLIEMRV